jgi:addiction module RelE/StbE family toxin
VQIEWTEFAKADLADILGYVNARNSQAAERIFAAMETSLEFASEHPFLYKRSERIPETREIVIQHNYIVLYRVGQTIEVVSVVHARQNYPNDDC